MSNFKIGYGANKGFNMDKYLYTGKLNKVQPDKEYIQISDFIKREITTTNHILFYLPIDKFMNETTINKLVQFTSNKKREQINRYHFDIDKKLSLYSDLLVRILACQILHLNNDCIEFEQNDFGKPYIKGARDFHYNISHTRNAIAVAISDTPIGIDIEKITNAELKIVNRFFTAKEQIYINKNKKETNKLFYQIWTKKEAYIKFIGKGLAVQLDSFDVLENKISRHISTFELDDYIISVCCERLDQKYVVYKLSEEQLEAIAFSLLN